ncbi:hypothetical protein N0V88_006587 [Collariella sp. IMI 366227]|nr:hypothetical protein N0V88_006587 [Collariella sp. IMI 366227]
MSDPALLPPDTHHTSTNETIVHRPKIVSNDEQKASASTSALSIRATSKQSTTNRQDSFAITIPVELRPEVYDLFEAMMYCRFGPAPAWAYRFHYPLVTVVLNHRIIQMAENPATNALVKPLWARMYRHLDVAIRTINKLMSEEKTRTHLLTLISVYTLLFAMGFMSLMQAFGSFSDVIRDIPDMEPSLMAVCIVSILANTTSPRNQQIQIGTAAETLFLIRTYFTETYYPTVSFPPELFTTIIHINNLRALSPSAETTLAALSLLSDLATFSPLILVLHPPKPPFRLAPPLPNLPLLHHPLRSFIPPILLRSAITQFIIPSLPPHPLHQFL